MRPPIRLIAVDIDGTLLNDHHQLTPRTEQALRRAQEAGIAIVLATGKTRYSSTELVKKLGLRTPGVFSQGLIIANPDGTLRHEITLPVDLAQEIAAAAVHHEVSFVVYRDMELFTLRRDDFTDLMTRYHEPEPRPVQTLDALMAQAPFQKFIFLSSPERLARLRPVLSEQFDGRLAIVFSQVNMLEFLPRGTSKGEGLRRLLTDLEVRPEEVIAFGDGDNDIEMLELAGIGVAMGNAMARPKEVADFVTATNNEDGIAAALERFLFQ